MLNILVTGANGQLGRSMRLLGDKSKNNYIFTDVDELNITSYNDILEMVASDDVNIIVNCAAYTNVERAEDEYSTASLLNDQAVENLALATREVGATLIHISTDYVFNGERNIPYDEYQATDPTGIYGRTKLDGERSIAEVGCKAIIIRTAWLYSEFGNNFVKTMMRLTSERETVNVVFDQVGTPTYAGDLAHAIFDIIESGRYVGNEGIYHYSNEGVCSWYDFAHEIANIAGNDKCVITPCHSSEFPSKVTRPSFSVLDKSKIKKRFDITIPHWRDSLIRCIEKLKNQNNLK